MKIQQLKYQPEKTSLQNYRYYVARGGDAIESTLFDSEATCVQRAWNADEVTITARQGFKRILVTLDADDVRKLLDTCARSIHTNETNYNPYTT